MDRNDEVARCRCVGITYLVVVLALTLVTMAGETNREEVYGALCWPQEAAGADRTAPAGREFDSVSLCVASRHAAPCRPSFLPASPLLSSSFFLFFFLLLLPYTSPHLSGLSLCLSFFLSFFLPSLRRHLASPFLLHSSRFFFLSFSLDSIFRWPFQTSFQTRFRVNHPRWKDRNVASTLSPLPRMRKKRQTARSLLYQ